jgi:acyl carrier protein
MTDADPIPTLRAVLAQVAPEIDTDAVDADADLRNDLDLDSMDFLNFVIGVSERLGVEIPEADYGFVATLAKCAEYVRAKQRG